eukprot:CAMPEP_0178444224 /NCGR_PEP_ID=MMETSP0689_2-20121128/39367_1 /TAXON_ID=160604 /ORGANISM="Amphidinium massartii, Strain CS-259" /LENGTH=119 /DNA_ID=CAMNT_0020068389 /DNA_START=170 /DNA_END=530 /DNA_ORIENTATION=-
MRASSTLLRSRDACMARTGRGGFAFCTVAHDSVDIRRRAAIKLAFCTFRLVVELGNMEAYMAQVSRRATINRDAVTKQQPMRKAADGPRAQSSATEAVVPSARRVVRSSAKMRTSSSGT